MRFILLLLLFTSDLCNAAEPLRLAVAANFRATLEQVNEQFQRETGHRVVLSSASTGVLYTQITHGAPFDLFFAADKTSTTRLATGATGQSYGQPFCYARGRLVLAGGSGDLAQLQNPALSLAIANPVTAPYGAAAMEVLAREEFASGAGRQLVRGANIVQAYQFWHSGSTDLALLPMSMAPAATPIPADWHQPLDQFAIALTPVASNPALRSYLNWIESDRVRTLIIDAGYEPCP